MGWGIRVLATITLVSAGCQGTGQAVGVRSSAVIGGGEALTGPGAAAVFEQRHGGTLEFSTAEDRMAALAARLLAANPDLDSNWVFRILAADAPNAFSLPSGRIYLPSGLYQLRIGEDNDLLAAVLAHEMAHVACEHGLHPPCRHETDALHREITADRTAAAYLSRAGYPLSSLADLLRLTKDLQPKGWAEARLSALTP